MIEDMVFSVLYVSLVVLMIFWITIINPLSLAFLGSFMNALGILLTIMVITMLEMGGKC